MHGDDFEMKSQNNESMNETQIEKLVNDCNDNNMFNLRNFIISLDDSQNSIEADTRLTQFLFENF
jgi:hypothetical protein